MDETTAKMASSSLAITEKRPHSHRPGGGCVGIFFQLFDWKRRLAKNKFFSKKLLSPVRAKQVSKKFVGDEKMPKTKLHWIADENSGGFPKGKKNGSRNSVDLEKKSGMRAPGLVARLMGLESMPDVQQDKPKKPSFVGSNDDRDEKFVNESSGSRRGELKDKGCGKIESRPQKIQKTEQFEGRAVTRFGAEALQIKSILSRSRRNDHPKLASPLKSSRVPSARNVSTTSRLVDVATKILEPGLQATNRAKSALTYSSSTLYAAKGKVLSEAKMESPDLSTQSTYNVGVCKSFMGRTSCRNCGDMLDVVDSRPNVDEQPFVYPSPASNFTNASPPGPGKSKPRSPGSSLDKERDVYFQQREQPISLSALVKCDNETRLGSIPSPDRKPSFQEGQVQWNLTSQQCKPKNVQSSSFTSKQRTQTQDQTSLCGDRMPPGAKLSNLPSRRDSSAARNVSGAKDFVAVNRNLNGRTRPRVPSKVDNSSIDAERKSCNQRDGSLSQLRTPVRKKRTIGVNGPVESTGFISSTLGRHRNFRSNMVVGKAKGLNSCSVDRTSIKSKAVCEKDSAVSGNKERDVISMTFNSPLRHTTGNALDKEKIKYQKGSTSKSALTAEQPISPDGHVSFQSKAKTKATSVGFACDGEHLSPGSVLEPSFSNDSCVSSSVDDSSGCRLQLASMDFSQDKLQPPASDNVLLDSATSLSKGSASNKMVIDLINPISRWLHSIEYVDLGLTRSKLSHAKGVILNAELLFGNTSLHKSDGMKDFLVASFLLAELEVLASAMQPKFNCLLGFESNKEGNQLRGFLFDCLIECFDAKYGRYCDSGFKAWIRLPLRMKAEMLIQEAGEEIIRWTHLAGLTPDEIMECEMSHSLGKWTDFDIEGFETGAQIGLDILQILIEEIVIDI